MLKRIIRKELLELSRDGRFRWSAGVLLVLLLSSSIVGWWRYVEYQRLQQKVQAEERKRWLNKGEMDPHPAMHFGFYVYKPQLPLAAADDGIVPYVGSYTLLEAHKQTLFQDKPAEGEVPLRRLSDLTAALCLQTLAPLLIVLLGFSSFVGEAEQGTLQQLLSLGVRRRDLIFGKMLGIATPLAVVLAPAALIGSVAILLSSATIFTDMFERVTLTTLAYLLYFLIFLVITFTVSLVAKSSRQSLVVLLLFWFTACLIAPAVAFEIAARRHPTPTGFQFVSGIEEERRRRFFSHYSERIKQIESELLVKYNVSATAELPVSPEGLMLLEEQQINDDIYNTAFHRLFGSYRQQNIFYQAGSIISPTIAIQSLSIGFAGTDTEAQEHFTEAARRYRSVMETTLNEDKAYNLTPGQRGRELWEKIPPFRYAPPRAGWVLDNYVVSFSLLSAWLIVALLALWRASLGATT
jgi:ABC-2 type transport system permease protein